VEGQSAGSALFATREVPLLNFTMQIPKVVADFYRIGQTVCVTQISAVRGIEAQMGN
jgi:hypothetical protein